MVKLYSRYSLLKRIVKSKQQLSKAILPFIDDSILPYEEKSSGYTKPVKNSNSGNMNAHELFNMFTADIIKEETIFVR
jgi:hypothetical protein